MMPSKLKLDVPILIGALLLAAGVVYLGFRIDRSQFWPLITAFSFSFVGYAGLVHKSRTDWLPWLIGLGILLRFILIFSFPLLSDDVYRFLWDGLLINDGQNPFAQLPAHYLESGHSVPGLTQELFDKLNSPDYYTIYPPVAQGVFTLATWLSPGNWYVAAVIMKLFLFLCELGSLWLLWQLFTHGFGGKERSENPSLPPSNLLFYWLNPLIIVEITGNLHFEGAMVFFLLLALYFLVKSHWVRAGLAMATSVASKLLPILLLPYLVRRLWGKPFWIFSFALGAAVLLFFTPLLAAGFLDGFGSSLDLYFRKFEFNASLYYLARAYGYYDVGWNQIDTFGPALAKIAAAIILVLALLDGRSSWRALPVGWLWAFLIYLLCATTVHPWYLSIPIVLCCFTRWRFPLVWSFLIMLTYTNYLTVPYSENLWLVAAEYLLVLAFFIWEWKFRPLSRSSRTHIPLAR